MSQPTVIGTPAFWSPALTPSATLSYNMSSTGTNRGLIITLMSDSVDWNPGAGDTATYAGASPTSVTTYSGTAVFDMTIIFWANPATGANNLVLTRGAVNTSSFGVIISGWQDIAQSSVIDTEAHTGQSGANVNISTSITPTVNNTTVLIVLGAFQTGVAVTDQGSQTAITHGAMSGSASDETYSSYLPVATAGPTSVGYNAVFPNSEDLFALSLKSPVAAVTTLTTRKTLLGVGI